MSQLQFITPLINREWQIKRNDEQWHPLYSKKTEYEQYAGKFAKILRGYPDQTEKAGESLAS